MSTNQRKIGGDNNKRGNRYEDFFVVFRLIEYSPNVITNGQEVRLKEQAACPVDDLLVVTPTSHRFHQLKAHKTITWSARDHKLTRKFLAQKAACQQIGQACELIVVVAEPAREKSLNANMPAELADCMTVLLFPELRQPSQLVRRQDVNDALGEVYAGRRVSVSDYQEIVRALHAAWIEHTPDSDGFCVLGEVIKTIRQWGVGRLRCDWSDKPEGWEEAAAILSETPGLTWWVDRGYFD